MTVPRGSIFVVASENWTQPRERRRIPRGPIFVVASENWTQPRERRRIPRGSIFVVAGENWTHPRERRRIPRGSIFVVASENWTQPRERRRRQFIIWQAVALRPGYRICNAISVRRFRWPTMYCWLQSNLRWTRNRSAMVCSDIDIDHDRLVASNVACVPMRNSRKTLFMHCLSDVFSSWTSASYAQKWKTRYMIITSASMLHL